MGKFSPQDVVLPVPALHDLSPFLLDRALVPDCRQPVTQQLFDGSTLGVALTVDTNQTDESRAKVSNARAAENA